jgi:OOP family OmpA-OmpF porin
MKKQLLLGLVCAAGVLGAVSASAADYGWYIGGNVGQSKFKEDCGGLTCDDTDTGYKLYGGYSFNKYLALELGYVDLGKTTFSGTVLGTPARGDIKGSGVNFGVVGTAPFGSGWAAFGKLGVISGEAKASVAIPGASGSLKETSTEISYGVGVSYDVTPAGAVRGEWDRYRFDFQGNKGDTDLLSIGVSVKF